VQFQLPKGDFKKSLHLIALVLVGWLRVMYNRLILNHEILSLYDHQIRIQAEVPGMTKEAWPHRRPPWVSVVDLRSGLQVAAG